MTDDQVLKSPSRPDGCVPGRRNMSMRQIWVGMGNRNSKYRRFHGLLYLRESFRLAGSPSLEHGHVRKQFSHRELFEYGKPRQSRARRVRKQNKNGVVLECPPSVPSPEKRCSENDACGTSPIQGPSVRFCQTHRKGNAERDAE